MIKENERKEKLCLFFASDYHFEMISLPYINENLKRNKDVVILTENDLSESVNKLLSNINLNEDEKNNIIQIDWKNDDLSKFEKIKQTNMQSKKAIIFVKGNEEYIENINKNIDLNNEINKENIEVINCYDINEVHNNVSNIAKKYSTILSTSGIEKLL